MNRTKESSGLHSRSSHKAWLWIAFVALAAVGMITARAAAHSDEPPRPATVTVHLDRSAGTIDPQLFGHMTEETLTSWEGDVSSQMLVDRKFSIPEPRIFPNDDPLYKGTGGPWEPLQLGSNVTLVQDEVEYYSAPMSERIENSGGTVPAGIAQKGFKTVLAQVSSNGRVPYPFHLRPGEHYRARLAVKNRDLRGPVYVALGESAKNFVARHSIELKGGEDWKEYQFELVPTAEAQDAKFMIYTESPGTVWVDSASLVRVDLDENGFRRDVLEATRKLQPTNVRWPGGLFVSDYYWKEGIGPVDKRPARQNRGWGVIYNNDIGVDEYVAYSRAVGSEPYIVINVPTGSPKEAADLVEYVNGPATSKWGRVRAQNGHKEPYNVHLWSIGNEDYLPTLGGTNATRYSSDYLAFTRAMRGVDPSIKIVAVGFFEIPRAAFPDTGPVFRVLRYAFDWGATFLPEAGKEADYYAIHYYEPGDSMKKDYTADDFHHAAMVISEDLSRKLQSVFAVMDKVGRHVPIALDEWRMTVSGDAPQGAMLDLPANASTFKDVSMAGPASPQLEAVGEAAIYNLMQRRPKDFGLSSRTILYADLIGILGISRNQVVFSPAAHMLELYATHDRCESLETDVDTSTFDVPPKGGFAGTQGAPYVDVSTRRHPNGTVDVFLVNRSLTSEISITLTTSGGPPVGNSRVSALSADKITAWNTFENPDRVVIKNSSVAAQDGKLQVVLPPYSVARISW